MNTFTKSSRLKSRKKLQQLFSEGKSIRTGNIRLVYLTEEALTADVKCGVGVPSRHFKNATDRNRIKRLLREAYRLQQHAVQQHIAHTPRQLSVFFLFSGKDLPDYNSLYKNVEVALQKLLTALGADTAKNI
ncbi:MAG: ribonuclease P protein component [Niabella sp.]